MIGERYRRRRIRGGGGTEAGGVETRRVDTEWKEFRRRGVDSCARKRSPCVGVRVHTEQGDARKGRDEGGYRGLERETPGELERKEELKDETEKDGV